MRTNTARLIRRFAIAPTLAGVLLSCGCASTPSTLTGPGGITYRKDPHLQKIWLAEGFDFQGYDSLYIAETQVAVPSPKKSQEAEMLEWARGYLREQLAKAIQAKAVFASVLTRESDVKPEAKILRLENTIIKFAKGSGSARFWAGEFGAGQPVLCVQGKMTAGDKPLFQFESFRSGDSAAARLDPGWTPEQKLQTRDINDLALDMGNFIEQTAKHQPRK
jgi:hypothetical protein